MNIFGALNVIGNATGETTETISSTLTSGYYMAVGLTHGSTNTIN